MGFFDVIVNTDTDDAASQRDAAKVRRSREDLEFLYHAHGKNSFYKVGFHELKSCFHEKTPNFENMKKLIILPLLFVACMSQAQHNNALGLRGGLSNGITFQHYFKKSTAVELILANRWRGYNFCALLEKHLPLDGASGLGWYYGAGVHVGQWRGYEKHPWFKDDATYNVGGVDLILGLEYTFKEAPINLSLDYKPAFNFYGYNGFWGDEGAFSIRFLF